MVTSFKVGDYVRITKRKTANNPVTESAKSEEYVYGEINALSLPVDYWLEGYLEAPIIPGHPVLVDRRVRNGVNVFGHFESTPVVGYSKDHFTTLNSVYSIEAATIQN
jgi:hypothetical protein